MSESIQWADAGTTHEVDRAWPALTMRHANRVRAYVSCVTREPSEVDDLFASAMASAWCDIRSRPTEQQLLSDPAPWLIGHARAECARWVRAHRREVALGPAETIAAPTPANEAAALAMEARRLAVTEWIRELPRQQMFAVWFRALLCLSFERVATAMSCAPSTAKTHYRRGLDALRERAAHSSFATRDGA
jgi:RNA polymerase sigma factor (sigma-70 family)